MYYFLETCKNFSWKQFGKVINLVTEMGVELLLPANNVTFSVEWTLFRMRGCTIASVIGPPKIWITKKEIQSLNIWVNLEGVRG